MPGKSPSERIEELAGQLRKLDAVFESYKTLTDFRLQRLEVRDSERDRVEQELRDKLAEQAAKNAILEERSRGQEKASDRGWQLWLAALGFGFGLISLLITAAFQLNK